MDAAIVSWWGYLILSSDISMEIDEKIFLPWKYAEMDSIFFHLMVLDHSIHFSLKDPLREWSYPLKVTKEPHNWGYLSENVVDEDSQRNLFTFFLSPARQKLAFFMINWHRKKGQAFMCSKVFFRFLHTCQKMTATVQAISITNITY